METENFILPSEIYDFCRIFHKNNKECYLVGGAVRNLLLKKEVSDYDFASNAEASVSASYFKNVIPTGIKHGTVTVLFKGYSFEVTTYRKEEGYTDSRHPDSIDFVDDIHEDLKRRDFTMNAIAYDPLTNELLDPHSGRIDLKNKVIRAIGNPIERFTEDALRPLRAIRFATQLDFTIEENTLKAIQSLHTTIAKVSMERVRDEFVKALLSEKPSKAIFLLEQTELLKMILPELTLCRGVSQKGYHEFDVFDHSLYACDGSPKDLILRLAALFHDLGKPSCQAIKEDGVSTFYNHEIESTHIAEKILKRFKFPTAVIERVLHLIKNHMFHYESVWSNAAVRRFIARIGTENLSDLFALREADCYGMSTNGQKPEEDLDELRERIEKSIIKVDPFSIKDLKINGNILASLGIPKGKMMGEVLHDLMEAVFDDPELNTEESLSSLALEKYKKMNQV